MDKYERERKQMVREQIERRGLRERRLLTALETVPRHLFVPEEYRYAAYEDGPLPIGFGQTISQPYIVALMTDFLSLKGNERVLEVGTGSGYQAAILGMMTDEVHTVEFIPELATRADKLLKELGMDNVHVHLGDGSLGWPELAPYQGILVAAAAPTVPKALLEQLEDCERLVLPVGARGMQILEIWERHGDDFESKVETAVAFVPLRGEQGWDQKKR
ncbi:MAG: protein-L-isoaspartate(D-aspartate) O-methyltransferase [Anaerolineales bacterium]|nr:protein-L-isoaspartate(D-aspartate) O-methyltransferase [Anaerolineales bacterium]